MKVENLLYNWNMICFVSLTGSKKYRCVSLCKPSMSRCEIFQVFSNLSASFPKRSHSTDPYSDVLKMLLVLMTVLGCANQNSCRNSLFLLMKTARFSIRSWVTLFMLLLTLVPKCFAVVTHGNPFPFNITGFKVLSFFKKAKHFVLHLDGVG